MLGPIEKGANDGQTQYAKDIIASLKSAVSTRKTPGGAGRSKKKNRKEKSKPGLGGSDGAMDASRRASAVKEDWGLLEPLRGPLGPVVDILKPLLSGNMVYGLLVGLLVTAWFSFGHSRNGGGGKDMGFFVGTPERIAAYEEMWRREESDLWEWLEERVGMDRMHAMNSPKTDRARIIHENLKDERVSDREVDIAIKVTEEKLAALKQMVEKQKMGKAGNGARKSKPGAPDAMGTAMVVGDGSDVDGVGDSGAAV